MRFELLHVIKSLYCAGEIESGLGSAASFVAVEQGEACEQSYVKKYCTCCLNGADDQSQQM